MEFLGANWQAILAAVVVGLSTVLVRLLELYGREASTLTRVGRWALSLAAAWTAKGALPRGLALWGAQVPGLSWSEPYEAPAEREARRRGMTGLLVLILTVGGCGLSLNGVQKGLNMAQQVALSGERVMAPRCIVSDVVAKCVGDEDRECKALVRCKAVTQALLGIHAGYVTGSAAVAVADKPSAKKALSEALKLVDVVALAIKAWR